MIYIFTGAIRTGKTSALLDWANVRNDTDGLLCPDNENGKRYFLKIKSGNSFPLEVEAKTEDVIVIGDFRFLKAAFQEANDYLLAVNEARDFSYLIVDELGKLELKNEGLHASAEKLIPQYITNVSFHLILVVRESLLEEVVQHYNIFKYSILNKEGLKEL